MANLFIYYHPKNNSFYYKYCFSENEPGFVNGYGHLLVQVFTFDFKKGKYVDSDFYYNEKKENQLKEYEKRKEKRLKKQKRKKLKNELINQVIDLLYKIKSR